MTEKDYSLLRPFDLEAARDGAAIVALVDGGTKMEPRGFVKGPDCMGYCVVVTDEGVYRLGKAHEYRMAPLCWVEGRPVYPGDGLWWILQDKWIVARGYYEHLDVIISVDSNDVASLRKLTWAKPVPIKRWINIYPNTGHSTKAAADQAEAIGRIACIEIELPPIKP